MIQLNRFSLWCLTLSLLADASAYKAVVVEYTPEGSVFNQTPAKLLSGNLAQYSRFVTEAALSGVDIIVFPEYGLTTLALSSLSRINARPFLQLFPTLNTSAPASLCSEVNNNQTVLDDGQLVFTGLSCLARQNSIYIVANTGEIVPCQPGENVTDNGQCPDDGGFQYSSNVVFDREGRIIARYRKTHLFLEPPFQEPAQIDRISFLTDFKVEFGLLTCFDIMYYEPALALYNDRGIKNFAFPTAWVDELPFLTAVQIQEGWSRSLGVNLLASGYHLPANGQLGSGVYTPTGAVNYTFTPDSGNILIVGDIVSSEEEAKRSAACTDLGRNRQPCNERLAHPSTDGEPTAHSYTYNERWIQPHGMLYENLTGYSSTELEVGPGKSITLCHDNLCCSLNYSSTCPDGKCDPFRLLSYTGNRTLGGGMYTVSIEVCGVVACTNQSVQSCARPTVGQTALLTAFQLSGNFSTRYVYPTANTVANLQPLPAGSLQLDASDNGFSLTSTKGLDDVMAVGLYGRAYDQDTDS